MRATFEGLSMMVVAVLIGTIAANISAMTSLWP